MRTSSLNIFTQVVTDECAEPRKQECFYLATNSGNLRGGCVFSIPTPAADNARACPHAQHCRLTDGNGLKPCSWGKLALGLPVMFRTLNSCFAKVNFPRGGSFATKREKYWQLKNKLKKFFAFNTEKHTVQLRTGSEGEADTFERHHKGSTDLEELKPGISNHQRLCASWLLCAHWEAHS